MDLLSLPFSSWPSLLFLLLAGALPTQIWRWLGAVFSKSLDEDSELIRWVKAVATALVAGLIANIVVFPTGNLALVPIEVRVGSLLFGFVVYYFTRPHIIFGILAGEALLIAAALVLR